MIFVILLASTNSLIKKMHTINREAILPTTKTLSNEIIYMSSWTSRYTSDISSLSNYHNITPPSPPPSLRNLRHQRRTG